MPEYFVMPRGDMGLVIYGRAYDKEEATSAGDPWHIMDYHQNGGYVYGMWYSVVEPTGEEGTNHISHCYPISERVFNLAQESGWQDWETTRNELMKEAEGYKLSLDGSTRNLHVVRSPYGTNNGDIWLGVDSEVGQMLLERDGLTMIHEMIEREGKLEEVIYSTKNPEIIARATAGHQKWVAEQARKN